MLLTNAKNLQQALEFCKTDYALNQRATYYIIAEDKKIKCE